MDAEMARTLSSVLEKSAPVVIASIISKKGSSPRTAGTKMLVFEDGTIFGTIGGGLLESEVIASSKSLFSTQDARIYEYDLSSSKNGLGDSLDMICGGRILVLLEGVVADKAHVDFYTTYAHELDEGKKIWQIAEIYPLESKKVRVHRRLMDDNSVSVRGDDENTSHIRSQILKAEIQNTPILFNEPDRSILIEPCPLKGHVFLFGAGHISQQVAALTYMAGFKTIVLDDRAEFANRSRFENADEIHVLSDFEDAFADLKIHSNSYIIIVTRGHRNDQSVLKRALTTNADYIGMIGSLRKWKHTQDELMAEGFSKEALSRVHCPIGLDMGAQTPFEIAISIIAEMIQHRSGKASP